MIRFSTIFTAICMVLIAASCGVVLHSLFGLGRNETAALSLALLIGLSLYSAALAHLRRRGDNSRPIDDLSRGTAELAHQVSDLGRRLAVVEGKLGAGQSVGHERIQSVIGEIGELGSLLQKLAASVATHEDMLSSGWSRPPAAPPPPANIDSPAAVAAPAPAPPPPSPAPVQQPARIAPEQIMMLVWQAIEAGRIDLYLQPTVTLPQRKVAFYEAVARIRDEDDRIIAAEDFVNAAEAAGLVGRLDHSVLMRAMQVLRRLVVRNDDVCVFCNLSAATLRDPDIFGQCLEFLDANKALAKGLVLEFRYAALRDFGAAELARLQSLAALGYRLSIDHVPDLNIDAPLLAERGVRFVKVAAPLLLIPAAAGDIAPADLPVLLSRYGIELIAERIEGERAVVDLLDSNIRFGQGFVFSAPRPLRPEPAMPNGDDAAEPAPQGAPEVLPAFPLGRSPIEPRTAPPVRPDPQRVTGNAALVRRAGVA
jgi:cyclic-di-GMP phosphodiesterase TipF (flagellum assembly factor)